jgi:N-acetylmuramoyl-L-alanine amidase
MKKICLFIACLTLFFNVEAAKKVIWVIDAGHGGRDVGCEGRLTREKDITLAVAKELGRLIKKNIPGVRVAYTREKDKYLTLQERCDVANNRGAALFISIHVNSAENQFARGTESFFATNVPMKGTQAGKSELLALLLQRQYLAHGRAISRGVKQRELYVCEHTNMPSVLTEIGFISNLNEEAYLNSKDGQQELADAICQALKEWKELTKDGSVAQRDLRNLRYTHYAPVSLVAMNEEPEATEPSTTTTATAPSTNAAQPTEPQAPVAKAQPEIQPTKEVPEMVPTVVPEEPIQQPATASAKKDDKKKDDKKDDKPYFAIQLMNTATKLKEGDYRLKGYKAVTYIPAGERFKVIYGRSESYKDIKNELAQVRETFPEAFIVAFVGERQITTAEALELLKK